MGNRIKIETKKVNSNNNKILDTELEIKKEKEKSNKNGKWLLLLLLPFLFVLIGYGITYSENGNFRDKMQGNIINNLKIDTPTRPMIDGGSTEWSKKKVVKVVKDAKSYSGIDYYEYCVSSDKDFSDCEWKKTQNKNMISLTTGKYYVIFRAVSKNGEKGKNSNIEETWIDNEVPTIPELKIDNTKDGVKVSISAEDIHSGVDSYYYKLDNGEYIKVEDIFNIKLEKEREYEITIKVLDKVGNSKEVSKKFVYNLEAEDTIGKEPEQSPGESVIPKPSDEPKPSPSEPPISGGNSEPEKIIVPEINLDKVPLEFFYGKSYELPSFVNFKGDTGTVSCIIKGVEYTDTSTLKIGKHLIVCTATSSKNVKAIVEKEVEVKAYIGFDELLDGSIKLNLYYPENSTNWKWRLGKEGEIRKGYDNTNWQEYTGPILAKLEDVDNVYIRYDLDKETIIVAPNGRVLVDIVPEAFTLEKNEKTKVIINYDKKAETKEYKVNDGDWQEYKGSFEVGVNTIIEARATKSEKVYDSNGKYVYTSKIKGIDSVFIGEKHNHVFDEYASVDDDNHKKICDCGKELVEEHSYGPWESTNAGVKSRKCEYCGHTQEVSHTCNLITYDLYPSTKTKDYCHERVTTCTEGCNHESRVQVAHDYFVESSSVVGVVYKCSNCGHSYEEEFDFSLLHIKQKLTKPKSLVF